jgi:hypothetical protein
VPLHRPPGARGGQQGAWLLKSRVGMAEQPVGQERLGLEDFCVPSRSARQGVTPFTDTSSGSSGLAVRRPGARAPSRARCAAAVPGAARSSRSKNRSPQASTPRKTISVVPHLYSAVRGAHGTPRHPRTTDSAGEHAKALIKALRQHRAAYLHTASYLIPLITPHLSCATRR